MRGPPTLGAATAPPIVRATPGIIAVLGAFWLVTGLLVLFLVPQGASGIGFAWVAWGATHLFAARGTRSGAAWAFVLDSILAVVGLLVATVIIFVIVATGQTEGRSLDPGAIWFSPLNGWATLLVYGLLVAANSAMLITAAWALRRRPDGA